MKKEGKAKVTKTKMKHATFKTEKEAKEFVDNIFILIEKSTSIDDLKNILNNPIIESSKMEITQYPKIDFKIEQIDIQSLIADNKIIKAKDDFIFAEDITSKIEDPLAKLLFAVIWKEGDFLKVKHIIKGIMECDKGDENQKDALVFYQFGKYLTQTPGQPIIDQHVIRAFAIYQSGSEEITGLRKLETLSKKHKVYIENYKKWLRRLKPNFKNNENYFYWIDQILFAAGKTVKL